MHLKVLLATSIKYFKSKKSFKNLLNSQYKKTISFKKKTELKYS